MRDERETLGRSRALLSMLADLSAGLPCFRVRNEGLRGILRCLVDGAAASWASVWIHEEATDRTRIAASFASRGARPDPLPFAADLAKQVARERRHLRVPLEATADGPEQMVGLPLLATERVLGVLIFVRAPAREETEADAGAASPDDLLIAALAGLAGVVIQQAELSDRTREGDRRVREMERMLLQSERLAALGEMSAKVAHEIRNPLSGIGGFARRIEKGLSPDDPNRSYASIIVREIRRLESLLSEQLLFAQRTAPRLVNVDLASVAREAVGLVVDELREKGVRLIESYERNGKPMLLDPDRVKQVILNILKNAAASTREGNRVRVATRSIEGWAQVEIANDGDRIPGEMLESLFVPFAAGRAGGCGLGLAVADQIVKEHGGEVRVRSSDEWSAIFTVSLPIRLNPDRRKNRERRTGGDRRRAA
ncbi:MAG: hypothetical protein FJY88_00505 [Candidatus Eisenbacteria bacterium]|nr:hypothetical protein [Candidatus Eisenbacteria bacterium]